MSRPSPIISIGFNQDCSCITVGTTRGYRVYSLHPFRKLGDSDAGGVRSVDMLFTTNLVAVVGAGEQPRMSTRCLRLLHLQTRAPIHELNFASTVLAVQMNAARLVAVLERRVHIFELGSMRLLHSLSTPRNPNGAVAFSTSDSNCYLALPSKENAGEVVVYDALNLKTLNSIRAHDAPIRCLALSADGTLLATASATGTIVRIFALPSGLKLKTFRRGSRPAGVWAMAFDATAARLCVCSDAASAHVFAVRNEGGGSSNEDCGSSGSTCIAASGAEQQSTLSSHSASSSVFHSSTSNEQATDAASTTSSLSTAAVAFASPFTSTSHFASASSSTVSAPLMPESASSSTSAFSSLGATVSADARQRVENAASLASSAVFSSQFIGVQGAGADDLDAEDNGSSVSADKREASHDFEDAVDDDEASVSPQTGESVSVAAAGESTSNSIVASAASPAVIPDLSSALPSEQAINQFVDSVSGLKACGSNENDQSVFAAAASDSGDLPPAPPSTSSYLGSMVSTLSSAVVSAYSTARSSISALPASLPAMPAMPAMPSIPSMASYAPMSSMLPDVRALVASYAPQYAADWVEAERSVAKITLQKEASTRVACGFDSTGLLWLATSEGVLSAHRLVATASSSSSSSSSSSAHHLCSAHAETGSATAGRSSVSGASRGDAISGAASGDATVEYRLERVNLLLDAPTEENGATVLPPH